MPPKLSDPRLTARTAAATWTRDFRETPSARDPPPCSPACEPSPRAAVSQFLLRGPDVLQSLQHHHRRIRDAPLEIFAIRLPVLEGVLGDFLLLLFFLLLAFLLVRLIFTFFIGKLQQTPADPARAPRRWARTRAPCK